jgi:uncharacterized membrane protein
MATVEKSIEVNVPLNMAYNQWTQFEEFPRFMEGVKEVRQLDDQRLYWKAEVGGEEKDWYARITRQVPDEVIAWQSEGGTQTSGMVRFLPRDQENTEIQLQIEYEVEDLKEQIGDALGVVGRQVEGDLKRFKEFVESRIEETGSWRGTIAGETTETSGHYGESSGEANAADWRPDERMRYGATGQGGAGYGGSPPTEHGPPAWHF